MDYQENRFSTSRMPDFLLLGGGLASATAAETLRLEGAEGSVVIVSAESRLPYHRPPLSGRLLKGEAPHEPPLVLNEEDYRARRIEVLRGVRALGVDPERHLVHTDKAGTPAYRKLLIATRATPVRLQLPGSASRREDARWRASKMRGMSRRSHSAGHVGPQPRNPPTHADATSDKRSCRSAQVEGFRALRALR